MKQIRISLPLTDRSVFTQLNAGDEVLLSGVIHTGRDAAHKRIIALLDKKEALPIDLKDQVIYYAGPTPARPGAASGSIGPTTSGRMDHYAPRIMAETGLAGMIGKGNRSTAVIDAMRTCGCVYFAAVGGAGALIAQSVVTSECVAWPELGPEAIYKLTVSDFPAIVAIDAHGNSLYESGPAAWRKPV